MSLAIANTTFGLLLGRFLPSGVREFRGVPYSPEPVRFSPPAPWTEPHGPAGRAALQWAAPCIQKGLPVDPAVSSENCLFLNVWSPPRASLSQPKPVAVFVHGGSFQLGAGSQYNGSQLCLSQDMVVVTINYRLGAFGFGAFREHLAAAETTGNWGLQDQREALRWVRAQVGSFGGDARRVLLFGESAGAISVQLHVIGNRTLREGLFSSALSESGMPLALSAGEALNVSTPLFTKLGCDSPANGTTLACMRGVGAAALLAADDANPDPTSAADGWAPTVDGVEFNDYPAASALRGEIDARGLRGFAGGTNTDEGTLFVYPAFRFGMRSAGYAKFIRGFVEKDGLTPLTAAEHAKLDELYPPPKGLFSDGRATASAVWADSSFVCGTRLLLGALQAAAVPSYEFQFDYRRSERCEPVPKAWGVFHGSGAPALALRQHHLAARLVPHAAPAHAMCPPAVTSTHCCSELSAVFNDASVPNPPGAPSPSCESWTPREAAIASAFGSEWASLAATGHPTAAWPEHSTGGNTTLVFGPSFKPTAATALGLDRRADFCDLWRDVYKTRYLHRPSAT